VYDSVLEWANSVSGAGSICVFGGTSLAAAADAPWPSTLQSYDEMNYIVFNNNDVRRCVIAIPAIGNIIPLFAQRMIVNNAWYQNWNLIPSDSRYVLKAGDTMGGNLNFASGTSYPIFLNSGSTLDYGAIELAGDGTLMLSCNLLSDNTHNCTLMIKPNNTGDPNVYYGYSPNNDGNLSYFQVITMKDREYKNWTPVISGATTAGTPTYIAQNGRAVRFGPYVHCWMQVIFTPDTAAAGDLIISGLPYKVDINYDTIRVPLAINLGSTDAWTLTVIDNNQAMYVYNMRTVQRVQMSDLGNSSRQFEADFIYPIAM
jgi:hypothetical protein